MNIVKRQQADDDIDHYTAFFTRKSGTGLAVRFLEAFEKTIANISRLPGIGSPYPVAKSKLEGPRAVPIIGFPNHILFYLWPSEDEIIVVRLMNASRNVARRLENMDESN